MKTIIMLDHGGVLDQDTRSTEETRPQREREYRRLGIYSNEQVNEMMANLKEKETDFRVVTESEMPDPGIFSVMPDAPETFRLLNELVDEYDCELVFHSSNSSEAQIAVKESLKTAMNKYNKKNPRNPLTMPQFTTMAILDPTSAHTPNAPKVTHESDMIGLTFHSTGADGKTDLRTAIAAYYNIPEEGHIQHFVVDDGGPNIRAAEREHYTAVRITPNRSTLQALNEIRATLQQRRQQISPVCEEVISPIQMAQIGATSNSQSICNEPEPKPSQTTAIPVEPDLLHATNQETATICRKITHGYHKHRQKHNLLAYDINDNPSLLENQIRQKLTNLHGDTLKKNILDALAEKLSSCTTQELPNVIQDIRNSYEYQVLQQRQNPWWFGQFFKKHTDSISELERMIRQAEKTEHLTPTFPHR